MRHFLVKLRWRGNGNAEIPVTVSAAAIPILQHLHGVDSVVILEERAADALSHRHHRKRLASRYGENVVALVYGAAGQSRLPDDPPPGVVIQGRYTLTAGDEDEDDGPLPPLPPPPPQAAEAMAAAADAVVGRARAR